MISAKAMSRGQAKSALVQLRFVNCEFNLIIVYGSGAYHSLLVGNPDLTVGTRSSRVLSTKADMFSLGMVIHFMAFRGRLPYIATGETLESLDELRREVQAFPGSLP